MLREYLIKYQSTFDEHEQCLRNGIEMLLLKRGERVGAGKLSGITMQWRDWRFSPPRKSAFFIHLESFTGTMRSEMDWKSGLCATSRPYRARKFRMIDFPFGFKSLRLFFRNCDMARATLLDEIQLNFQQNPPRSDLYENCFSFFIKKRHRNV